MELARQLAANVALSKDRSLAMLRKDAVLITDAQARFADGADTGQNLDEAVLWVKGIRSTAMGLVSKQLAGD